MTILDLKQAAELLKMSPEGLRQLAASGKIPGAKIGKCWRFLATDLVEHLQSLYAVKCKVSQGVHTERRKKSWHSVNEKISGGSDLVTKAKEYRKAVGLPID